MAQHYQHRYEYVSEGEWESESESESGSESEEEKEPQCWQRSNLAPSRGAGVPQRGTTMASAGAGRAYQSQHAQDKYYAQLNQKYYNALALEGCTSPMSSESKSRKSEKESGCTYNESTMHNYGNRATSYAQNNNYDLSCFDQEDCMDPIRSKLATPKKQEQDHNYTYYGTKTANNGYVGHTHNNNKSLEYISQEACKVPLNSKPTTPKKREEENNYTYYENKVVNNGYEGHAHVNNKSLEYSSQESCKVPLSSKDTTSNKRGEENNFTYYENKTVKNGYEGHARSNNKALDQYISQEGCIVPSSSKPITSKTGGEEHKYTFYENKMVDNGYKDLNYVSQEGYMIPLSSKPTIPKKLEEEDNYAYYDGNMVNNGGVERTHKNYKDLKYISQEGCTLPMDLKPKINKNNMQNGCPKESKLDGNGKVSCTTRTTHTTTTLTTYNKAFPRI